eukprot:tig00000219_g19442.t1
MEASGYPPSCPVEDAVSIAQCSESSRSCVSVFNEDEAHFAEPWMYDGPREKALAKLRRLLASRGDARSVSVGGAAERGGVQGYIHASGCGASKRRTPQRWASRGPRWSSRR